jgi:signal transduction histidine kinase
VRKPTTFLLQLHLPSTDPHYPPHIENHIFRIVQQACENAFRYAQAERILISGTLAPARVELLVEDDGVGFPLAKPLDLASLLAHKHFGLVHMLERAAYINAELLLDSAPGQGTRVRLRWSARDGG